MLFKRMVHPNKGVYQLIKLYFSKDEELCELTKLLQWNLKLFNKIYVSTNEIPQNKEFNFVLFF